MVIFGAKVHTLPYMQPMQTSTVDLIANKNFSTLASPLCALTKRTQGRFIWTVEAQVAFEALKKKLTSAPVLQMPNSRVQFIVEVDTSNTGVGAVLSQCSGLKGELHPCAYYSHWLIAPERNYEVGDRELQAIKLALEKWRHWLEGAKQPFLILTDHQNLTHIQQAKWLNLRQAGQSLFFARFDFTLSFKPRGKES
ncbi:hypothetical protein QTP86_009135 [Hemibagrus guttatus]|nr:hypothetical protein QTP86_009135 [Hemibagrus guttatus]